MHRMRIIEQAAVCLPVVALSLFTIEQAKAQDCVCLKHTTSQQIIYDCEDITPENRFYPVVSCRKENGTHTETTVIPPWEIVPEGSQGCSPCRSQLTIPDGPRGDGAGNTP